MNKKDIFKHNSLQPHLVIQVPPQFLSSKELVPKSARPLVANPCHLGLYLRSFQKKFLFIILNDSLRQQLVSDGSKTIRSHFLFTFFV